MVSKRRRRDSVVAAGIAVVLVALTGLVFVNSDERHLERTVAAAGTLPLAMNRAPSSLTEAWRMAVPSQFAPVVSPNGSVVTADDHTVVGYDATTGEKLWDYSRSNIPICAFGSGDTEPVAMTESGGVRGVLVAYSKSDRCTEITTLNPQTGDRSKQRTVEDELNSQVAFGGPYAGFIGPTLIELWRFDLVRTIQYGDQPTPTKSGTKHLGCQFNDIAIADKQFATIEHCTNSGGNAQLVVNWADPDSAPPADTKGWDNFKFEPRGTVDLGAPDARLLAITPDNIAVLVGGATPEIVVYGMVEPDPVDETATGEAAPTTTSTSDAPDPDPVLTEISRKAVDVDDTDISSITSRVTPATIDGDDRYSVIGDTLVAVRGSDLAESWTLSGVLGTVAVVGSDLLVPVEAGIAVVDSSTGSIKRTLDLDRGGYSGPVDVHTAGSMVVETRGSEVVAFATTDGVATTTTSEPLLPGAEGNGTTGRTSAERTTGATSTASTTAPASSGATATGGA